MQPLKLDVDFYSEVSLTVNRQIVGITDRVTVVQLFTKP